MEHQGFTGNGIVISENFDKMSKLTSQTAQTQNYGQNGFTVSSPWLGKRQKYHSLNIPQNKKHRSTIIMHALNVFAVTYFVWLLLTSFIGTSFYFAPEIYDPETLYMIRVVFCFILINVIVNHILVITTAHKSAYTKMTHTNELPDASWSFCKTCQMDIPPRCHHCALCGICILKHDHHCFFTASCIGFYNQRYFTVFCFYVMLGTGLSGSVLYQYINSEHLIGSGLIHLLLPVALVETVLGYATWYFLGIVTLLSLTFGTFLISAFYWGLQMWIIYKGQTCHEFQKKDKMFSTNPSLRFKSVFGPLWLLNFVVPLICFPNKGNGIDWTEHTYKYI